MNRIQAPLFSLLLLLASTCLTSAGEPVAGGASPWLTDLDTAKARAKAESKDLLLFFTGSDWCPPCKKLTAEVMLNPEFLAVVTTGWILVELDFPQQKEQPAAIRERNERLAAAYGVQGFPTVILTDALGRAFARTGYQEAGPAGFLANLKELSANKTRRDGLLEQAATAKGLEKARLLDAALSIPGETLIASYDAEVAAILAADADGKGELKGKYLAVRMRAEIGVLIQKGELAAAAKSIDDLLADPTVLGQGRQEIHLGRASVALQQGDQKAAIAQLKLAIAAKPDSSQAASLTQILKRFNEAPRSETTAIEPPADPAPAKAPEPLMPVPP